MKLNLKTFAGAAAIAASLSAVPAQALVLPSDTAKGGSLFVAVYDTVLGTSVVKDLGLFFADFSSSLGAAPGIAAGALTARSFTIDMSVFSTSNLSDVRYSVFAGDSAGGGNSRHFIATNNGGVSGMTTGKITGVNTAATGLTVSFNNNCASATVCTSLTGVDDPMIWGESLGGSFTPLADAGLGESLGFYLIAGTGTNAATAAAVTQFADSNGAWSWSLTQAGDLTFGGAAAPVPLPAAAWLLISGLLGVGALGRRNGATA